MTTRRGHVSPDGASGVGGDWAAHTLGVLACYLTGYTKVLRQKSLKKAYIDAFANSHYRRLLREEGGSGTLLFPDLARTSSQAMLEGSARVALKVEPRFDRYLFLDRQAKRNLRVEGLKVEFSDRAADIRVAEGDANVALRSLCARDWHYRRAVLFLDPFDMQVEWATLEAIGKTRAIDLWLFFPLGFGSSQTGHSAIAVPELWTTRLAHLLGGREWCDALRDVDYIPSGDGLDGDRLAAALSAGVGRRIAARLKQAFAGVAGPAILRGPSHGPLYLVCFAAGNPRNVAVTLRQAQVLLDALE